MDFSVKQIHLRIIQKNSVLNEYHFHRPSCNNIPKNWGKLPTQNRTTEKHNNNNNVVLTRRQKSYLGAYENEKIQEYKLVYFTKIDELLYLQTFFMRKKHTYTSNFFTLIGTQDVLVPSRTKRRQQQNSSGDRRHPSLLLWVRSNLRLLKWFEAKP